jgi:hypothetical protein
MVFDQEKIVKELRFRGVSVLKGVLSSEDCANIIEQIEASDITPSWEDNFGSDKRYYGIENRVNIPKFLDKLVNEIHDKYFPKTKHVNTWMYNHIRGVKNNEGSGGGWHRDDPVRNQLKFILYLNDVDESNGPFKYITGSHTVFSKILTSLVRLKIVSRFSSVPSHGSITYTGKSGTIIIADTSGIHRGSLLELGTERKALTSYSYRGIIPEHISNLIEVHRR